MIMLRSLGLPRAAAGLVLLPLAALVAAACGGSDVVSAPDASLSDASQGDAASPDARLPTDAPLADEHAPDGRPSEAGTLDAAASDAAPHDADANAPDTGPGPGDATAEASDSAIADSAIADSAIADSAIADSGDARADAALGDGGLGLLGTAKRFAVLGGSTVTITPSPPLTSIVGDVGVSPGTSIATLGPGQPVGAVHAGDPVAAQAQADLTIAYDKLAGLPCLAANVRTGVDLGGETLPPGVYCFPNTSAGITGNLVLDAQLDPNAMWVFQVGSTLTTATNATVTVINGGSACNVYWQVGSSATLGTGTRLVGNVIALASVTLVTGAAVMEGRTLARVGAVNLDGNVVAAGACQ